ncbi:MULTISPECIES: phage tail tip lysozyme [unclassified Bilifractor]|uniref:phage tail tip lysozyme n=1 Tax=unclassified Bilifractor TaxID=2815795 RepID=UPI003F9338DD
MHYKKIILALTAAGMIASQTVPAYAEENSNVTSVSSASGVVSASSGADYASASTSGSVSSSQDSSAAVSSSSAGNTSSGSVETPENAASGDNATSSSSAGSGTAASNDSATNTSGENGSNTNTNTSGGTDSTKEAASGNADAAGKDQSDDSDKKSTEVSDATRSQAEQEAERAAQNEQSIQPVVPAGVAGTVDQTAAEKETFAYLTEVLGLNNAAASGLLANFYQETMFQYKAVGGNGIAYGLAQWTGGNFTSLANWCGANGRDYTTIDGQMYYLKYDLETNYPAVYAYLKGLPNTAEGAGAAAAFFCTYYERPAYTETRAAERTAYALQVFWPRYQSYILEQNKDVKAYMDWLAAYTADQSHGYSTVNRRNNPDVDAYSLIFYALYDNGYLLAESDRNPFDQNSIVSELTEHGFAEASDAETDPEKLEAGDIILYTDNSGAAVYRTADLVWQAKETDADKASGNKAGDQTDEVGSGELDTSKQRKVYRLKTKDASLPAFAQKMVDQLSNKQYMYSDNIRQIKKTDEDSYTFLFQTLKSIGELKDVDTAFTKDTMDHVLCTHSYQNIEAQIAAKKASLSVGDIVWNPESGAAVYLGSDRYIFMDNEVDQKMADITGISNCRYLETKKMTGAAWTAVYHKM